MNSRFHLVVNSHDTRIFVPKCDFVSAYGWGAGGADARTKLGLPGGGPRYVVTPLCVMDFEEEHQAHAPEVRASRRQRGQSGGRAPASN